MDNYTVIKRMGQGSCGTVYLAQEKKTNKYVIIKKTTQELGYHEQAILFHIKRECEQYFVCINNYFTENGKVYIVLDYIPHTRDLFNILWEKQEKLRASLRLQIALNLLKGLYVLHKNNIIHRDVKTENVMINREGEIHYIDFGFSCSANAEDEKYDLCLRSLQGSPLYFSPHIIEIFKSHGLKDLPAKQLVKLWIHNDIFGLGCILYELLLSSINRGEFPERIKTSGLETSKDIEQIIEIIDNIVSSSEDKKRIFKFIKMMLLDRDKPVDYFLDKFTKLFNFLRESRTT